MMKWNSGSPQSSDLLQSLLQSRDLSAETMAMGIKDLPDEALFANIDIVADRIKEAMYKNEPLVIFGHDDPDGVTSTYILYKFLNSLGYQKHQYYIPNRNLESHGIQEGFIDYVRRGGFKLVITVDNGISSSGGVEALNAMGCDVVITDHHLIQPDTLPKAYTILNPQLPDCEYPFKALAGVGVALMLIRYLSKVFEHPLDPVYYFWTAVGSLADKVPMLGVNWILVRHVIDNLESIQDYTLDFLLRNHPRITNRTEAFGFIQSVARLIANGREPDGQHTALRFMLQLSDDKAKLFESLERQKNIWEADLNRVFRYMDTITEDFGGNAFIYFDDDDFIPYNLLGTAASYVVNRFGIPTIMLKTHNGRIVCEGRCSDGFNMVDSFTACKTHLHQYGGHPKAAGFVMDPANYDSFIDCFNEYLTELGREGSVAAELDIDAELELKQFNRESWNVMESILPYGQKNPEPVLMIKNVNATELNSRFSMENSGMSIPMDANVDIAIYWKNYGVIRVIDYRIDS